MPSGPMIKWQAACPPLQQWIGLTSRLGDPSPSSLVVQPVVAPYWYEFCDRPTGSAKFDRDHARIADDLTTVGPDLFLGLL